MCGTVRFEEKSGYVPKNNVIPKDNVSGEFDKDAEVKWVGFVRTDGSVNGKYPMPKQWAADKWKVVRVRAVEFTEKDAEGVNHRFKTQGKEICGLVNEKNELRILTRPARENEIHVHERMPVTTARGEGFIEFLNEKINSCDEEK